MVAQQRKHKLPPPPFPIDSLFRSQVIEKGKERAVGQTTETIRLIKFHGLPRIDQCRSACVHRCVGRGFGGRGQFAKYTRVCAYMREGRGRGMGVRVCRLMDSGVGARDWLQCRSRALCANAQRVQAA